MSVLDFPRIHFRGALKVNIPTAARNHMGHIDVSTNTVYMNGEKFDPSKPAEIFHDYLRRLGPHYNAQGVEDEKGEFNAAAGWNYNGRGCSNWEGVRIVGVQTEDERMKQDDLLLGSMVELWGHYNEYLGTAFNDPRQVESDQASEWTTQIFSGRFTFGRKEPSHTTPNLFTGDVSCIQHARWLQFDHIRNLPAHCYRSELGKALLFQFSCSKDEETFQWSEDADRSPALAAFKKALNCPEVGGIVVQYLQFNFPTPLKPDTPTFYEIVGSIGLWKKDELKNYPAGRLLVPKPRLFKKLDREGRALTPRLGNMTVQLKDQRASFNMLAAIPVMGREDKPESPAEPLHRLGPKMDLGALELRVAGTNRLLARIPREMYDLAAYKRNSGLVDVPLRADATAEIEEEIANRPLYLTAELDGERVIVLEEQETVIQTNDGNVYLEFPDHRNNELYPSPIEIRSFVRGRPAAVRNIRLKSFYNTRCLPHLRYEFEKDPVNRGKRFDFPKNSELHMALFKSGRAEAPGEYLPSCFFNTDENGIAWITAVGNHGGGARVLLATEEQLQESPFKDDAGNEAEYNYDYHDSLGVWPQLGWFGVRTLPDDWSYLDVPSEKIDFKFLYENVLSYYEVLYPFMKTLAFSLAEGWKCEMYAHLMWQMCDPKNKYKTYCMPVTRELSRAKAMLFLKYMRNAQTVRTVPEKTQTAATSPRHAHHAHQTHHAHQGRQAHAAPPAPQKRIENRAQLVRALKDAIELELSLLFQYLYAAYSLPNYTTGQAYVQEGRWTEEQLRLICGDGQISQDHEGGWRAKIIAISHEEMTHFLIANNLLMAIGEPFYLRVPSSSEACKYYPLDVEFSLEPFSARAIEKFIQFEWPGRFERSNNADFNSQSDGVRSYRSVSELYGLIREAFKTIPDLISVKKGKVGGEHRLFLNEFVDRSTPDYQNQVDDVQSALYGIDVITERGEGTSGDSSKFEQSHFHQFRKIAREFHEQQNLMFDRCPNLPPWDPAYPAIKNPTLQPSRDCMSNTVTAPQTRRALEFFEQCFEMMSLLMVQHFHDTPNESLRRSELMNCSIDIMAGVIRPLSVLLMTMPSGVNGRTAGPSYQQEEVSPIIGDLKSVHLAISDKFKTLTETSKSIQEVPNAITETLAFYIGHFKYLANRF